MKSWPTADGKRFVWIDEDEKPFVCIDLDGEHLNLPTGKLYGSRIGNRNRLSNFLKENWIQLLIMVPVCTYAIVMAVSHPEMFTQKPNPNQARIDRIEKKMEELRNELDELDPPENYEDYSDRYGGA
jgi:hypothetical protein